ncbi:hypothetical protein QUC31_002185, partial [Theobroma cacao]
LFFLTDSNIIFFLFSFVLCQLLLIGGQVNEALSEVEKFCNNSRVPFPFRIRASLLECFYSNDSVMLSTCFEETLKKDPTCCHSLARLVSMQQNGFSKLLTYKVACASHLYGQEFNDVGKVYCHFEEQNDREILKFLKRHIENSIRLNANIQEKLNQI